MIFDNNFFKGWTKTELDLWAYAFKRGYDNPNQDCPYTSAQRALKSGWLNGQKYMRVVKDGAEILNDLKRQGYTKEEAAAWYHQKCVEDIEAGRWGWAEAYGCVMMKEGTHE